MADGPGAAAEDGRETPQGQHEQEGGPAVEDAGGDSGIVLREDIDSRREPEVVQQPQPKQRQVRVQEDVERVVQEVAVYGEVVLLAA